MNFDLRVRLARAWSGWWRYLGERAHGRAQVQLEHARNLGTAQAILLLPPGGELWETEPGGRTRVIRTPHHSVAGVEDSEREIVVGEPPR
jgi:hypothetical protein